MSRESAEAIDLLGKTWQRIQQVSNAWLKTHTPTEGWETHMSPSERCSLHLGAFVHSPDGRELVPWDYDATPVASCAFASTGVDGEHFNVMLDPEVRGVIVLTAPMAFDRPNTVVGESVDDFLGLVVAQGMAPIPNVAYRGLALGAQAIAHAPPLPPDTLVAALRRELSIQVWPDIEGRLRELQDRYAGRLRQTRQ